MACVKCEQGDHSDHVDVYQGTECIGCGCTSVKKGGGMKTLVKNDAISDKRLVKYPYIVVCDDCKVTIKHTFSFIESVAGGWCGQCKRR